MSVLCTVVTVLRCTAGWALQVSVGSGHSSGSHVLVWALLSKLENWLIVNLKNRDWRIIICYKPEGEFLNFKAPSAGVSIFTHSVHVYFH